MDRLRVDGIFIEYEVEGTGEPVLLIPVGVVADGLGHPLLAQSELASRYRLIHYHRRGYVGSTSDASPPTVARQAVDAAALLRHLSVPAAHVVGHSIGGLIALELAAESPALVHSLALLEPPLPEVARGDEHFAHVIGAMLGAYHSGDKRLALESFAVPVFGPEWQTIIEHAVPGGLEQALGDFDSFVRELGTLPEWRFGRGEAAAIRQPVLSVVGARGAPFVRNCRELLHSWFPQTEDVDLDTTHLLQMQNPAGMAHALAAFFARHPI